MDGYMGDGVNFFFIIGGPSYFQNHTKEWLGDFSSLS